MFIKQLVWKEEKRCNGEDTIFIAYTDIGRFTVLDRLTGYGEGNYRDIETGYKDNEGKFWLASGQFDIRKYPDTTIIKASEYIKKLANTCIGV